MYAIFDLLYLDGHSLMELPYTERRARLEQLGLGGRAWRVPAARVGEGTPLLEATREQGLEGVVAKRLDSRYEPGRRSGAWLKVKNTTRQELVIGGWMPGEGRRSRADRGAVDGLLPRCVLRLCGPGGDRLHRADARRAGAEARAVPARRLAVRQHGPRFPREAVFVEPCLVAEIEFREWTGEGVMRAPSFKGLREDKSPREVVREGSAEDRGTLPPTSTPIRPRRCSTRSSGCPRGR